MQNVCANALCSSLQKGDMEKVGAGNPARGQTIAGSDCGARRSNGGAERRSAGLRGNGDAVQSLEPKGVRMMMMMMMRMMMMMHT